MIAEFNELRDGIINRIIEMMILIACVVVYFFARCFWLKELSI